MASAKRVAHELGIAAVHAGLTPEAKLSHILSLRQDSSQRDRPGVIMVRLCYLNRKRGRQHQPAHHLP